MPDWPYPFLFHGGPLSRNIFFLDAVIEWGAIDLGKNPIRDAWYHRYPRLNHWFHYSFFNGFSPIVNSAESLTLLPKLYRLKRSLIRQSQTRLIVEFLYEKFAITQAEELFSEMTDAVEQIIAITEQNELVAWGIARDEGWIVEHQAFIESAIRPVRAELVLNLPHLRWMVADWKKAGKLELKELRRIVAETNKANKARSRNRR